MSTLHGTAMCRLTPRGIAIDLRVGRFRPRVIVIDIPFADVDELTRVTYIEAASDPNLGPNANDVRECLKGRIARPKLLHLVQSTGTTLVIRGRDLFYLVTVDRAGAEAALGAYDDFQSVTAKAS